jgi:hypothetical protein
MIDRPAWHQAIEEEFACSHEQMTFRLKIASNGVRHYWWQCMRCGQGRPATKDERRQQTDVEPFDEQLHKNWYEAKHQAWKAAYANHQALEQQAWLDEHSEYLASPKWRAKRRAVLQRDKYLCQATLEGCSQDATQVHHLSYNHWQNEPLFELIAVCAECHESITQMGRQRRGAA